MPKAEDDAEEENEGYIIIRSNSTVLASASNKLSTWVSIKMNAGWKPHANPQLFHDGEKFHLIQAMIK